MHHSTRSPRKTESNRIFFACRKATSFQYNEQFKRSVQ